MSASQESSTPLVESSSQESRPERPKKPQKVDKDDYFLDDPRRVELEVADTAKFLKILKR